MNVGVNLLWMVHGVVGGSETYTTSQLRALAVHRRDVELTLFARRELATTDPDLAERYELVRGPVAGGGRPVRVLLETTWLARQVRRRGLTLVHHPGGTIPRRSDTRTVLTVHDLQWLAYPQFFSRTKLAYVRAVVPSSIRRADVVVVNSEFVAGTVLDATGISLDRVRVVPPAVSVPEPSPSAPLPDGVGGRPFVLYPAITYPHKNHLVLLRALAAIAPADRPDLVLSGGAAQSEPDLGAEAERLGVAASVRRIGRVPQDALERLYAEATAVVFPSRYEGFGMGVVEAMARGCPVVAARATALPEVIGDAGVLVDPDDPEGWAGAIASLLGDGPQRARLAAAGRARVAAFRPPVVADRLADAYRDAAS